jgi:hypothetical protein
MLFPLSLDSTRMSCSVGDSSGRGCGRGRARRVAGETRFGDAPLAEEETEHDEESKETEEYRPDVSLVLARDWNFSHGIPHC